MQEKIITIKVKFYERHEDGEAVYTKKAYDYFCRFMNVEVGMPVVVESAFGLGLAKVTAVNVEEGKATKHMVGFVVTDPGANPTAEENGARVLEAERRAAPRLSPPTGLKPPPKRDVYADLDDKIPF